MQLRGLYDGSEGNPMKARWTLALGLGVLVALVAWRTWFPGRGEGDGEGRRAATDASTGEAGPPRSGLTMTIRGSDGNPLAGATVSSFWMHAGALQGQARATADAHGLATLVGLSAGRSRIVASGWDPSGRHLAVMSTVASGSELGLVDLGDLVPTGHAIEVELGTTAEDTEGRTAHCFLFATGEGPAGQEPAEGGEPTWELLLPLGRPFTIHGLKPGTWTLMGSLWLPGRREPDPSFLSGSTSFNVPDGGAARLEFAARVQVAKAPAEGARQRVR